MSRDLSGTIDGDAVRLASAYDEAHGDALSFTFTGKVTGDQMSGTLDMGEYLRRDVDGRRGTTPWRGDERAMAASLAGAAGLALPGASVAVARAVGRAAEVRPAAAGRPRHRRAERHERGARRGHRRRARSRRSPSGSIPPTRLKTVDVSGLYVTPGLVDIHVHVYTGTGEKGSYAGDNSVYPDGFTLRVGRDHRRRRRRASGWRNFDDFKERIIDRSKTRVLAFLNIVGNGMRGASFEQDLADMEAEPTAEMALRHQGPDRRHQDRALRRARSGRPSSARSRPGRCADIPGDGGLRREPARSARWPSS